jgi:galactokinase
VSTARAGAEAFLETLRTLPESPQPEARALFAPGAPVVVARAPGRLDVMGGIADYSGSLVLQLPLREATFAAVQRQAERTVEIVSLPSEGASRAVQARVPLAALEEGGRPAAYEQARAFFAQDPLTHWAAYVAGAFLVLARERGASFAGGARILVSSTVPGGKGVSSSAALEVAAMKAVAGAFALDVAGRDLALLCQKVENLVVGAPCGVMDQMTAACGTEGRLLALLCQPAELREPVALPDDVALYGIDSGLRHAVTGADYTSVRVAAFMGHRLLMDAASLGPRDYLANLDAAEFDTRWAAVLPERMSGADFLRRWDGTTDPVTTVDPAREYAVRVATAHPVHEHARVRAFADLLRAPAGPRRRQLLGTLMRQSHASYSACGLGSAGTDRLVELAGGEPALHGAKITGGGSGGTVAILADAGAAGAEAVARVAGRYRAETGHAATVFEGSSPGADAFGLVDFSPPAPARRG